MAAFGVHICHLSALAKTIIASCQPYQWFWTSHRAAVLFQGDVDSVLLGVGSPPEPWAFAALPTKLPGGSYQLDEGCQGRDADQALLGWMLAKREAQNVALVPHMPA